MVFGFFFREYSCRINVDDEYFLKVKNYFCRIVLVFFKFLEIVSFDFKVDLFFIF